MLEPRRLTIGEGLISGYLSVFLSLVSLGAVICFLFPEYFTTEEFRDRYPIELIRWILFFCLVFSFLFAFSSLLLGKKAKYAFIGMTISILAILLGGSGIEIKEYEQSIYSVSLDWMLLEILVLSLIFVPIELFFPKRTNQSKFHSEWKTDLVYLFKAQLLVQYTAAAVKMPAELFFSDIGMQQVQGIVSNMPYLLQLYMAMFAADLFQ